jgi:hypothetical protein
MRRELDVDVFFKQESSSGVSNRSSLSNRETTRKTERKIHQKILEERADENTVNTFLLFPQTLHPTHTLNATNSAESAIIKVAASI